jgi:hypothetical protein
MTTAKTRPTAPFEPNLTETTTPSRSPTLIPSPSELRHGPICTCAQRIKQWKPHPSVVRSPDDLAVSKEDLNSIQIVMSNAWREGTLATYGTGLMHYHASVFCDLRNIAEDLRAPASPALIEAFIASLAGRYSASTIGNYIAGVRVWHIFHHVKWKMDKPSFDAMLKATHNLAPPASSRPLRSPLTVQTIEFIAPHFNPSTPLDAAAFACLTTTFWCMARLGEFVVPKVSGYDAQFIVTREHMEVKTFESNLEQTLFHLPRTKSALNGEDVYWAKQDGLSDPQRAMEEHITTNHDPPPNTPLFAYKTGQTWKALSRHNFLKRINAAMNSANLPKMQGHSIRIGAVLEYLLRGLSFDIVKTKGRWASDAFSPLSSRARPDPCPLHASQLSGSRAGREIDHATDPQIMTQFSL